ncbi:MAG: TetR/AcrR family transcriptional regulator [Pseudomonadota bacterium]
MTSLPSKPLETDSLTDGRHARSERQRRDIQAALRTLVAQGNYAPTASEVADLSGASVRTVFRHFSDVDSLYASINDVMRAEIVAPRLNQPWVSTSLHHRIEEIAARRTDLFEQLLPFVEFQYIHRHRSDILSRLYQDALAESRETLRASLCDFVAVDTSEFDVAAHLLGPSGWRSLRLEQGYGRTRARKAITESAQRLLGPI